MATYYTKDGDMLDWICWKHYGIQSGAVETVLAWNEGLEQYQEKLPAGLLIELPELEVEEQKIQAPIKLWD